MPQLGLEVTEGTVTNLLVRVGDTVKAEQPLLELETDKAITEVVAPSAGLVASIDVEPGQTVPVGAPLLTLTSDSAEAAPSAPPPPAAPGAAAAASAARAAPAVTASRADPPRLRVAPVARRAAAKLGIDLTAIAGTGPRGRITLYDVQAAAPSNGNGVVTPPAQPGRHELSATRRAIARRMTLSQAIPQYHLVRDVDATHLLAEAAAQKSRGSAVGVNDLLVQAIAETAARHAGLATSFVDGDHPHLLTREDIDVGLAVATDRGLIVPVVRGAHRRGLEEIAGERRRLVERARDGRLGLDEMTGAVVTLSSLAAKGIDRFTAMINPGENAIVAVGRTVDRLVPRGRTIAILPTLTLTVTFDHRVVDGAVGADALGTLVDLLEGRMTWRP